MNKDLTYASNVPLIGGETIGLQQALNSQRSEYLASYSPFRKNDNHLLNYYDNEVDYRILGEHGKLPYVNIINAVPPCSGLSSYSTTASIDNKMNDWLLESTKHTFEMIKPDVLWGENAPRLSSKFGRPVGPSSYFLDSPKRRSLFNNS